jgi:hypothetical protein
MKSAFFYAVIISLWGATGAARQSPAAEPNVPPRKPARAAITKVFHDQRPAKSPPRLLRDVIGSADVDWSAVAQRAASSETSDDVLVTWNATAREKLIIRFEYRQENAAASKMKQQENPKIHGKTYFSVNANELKSDGAVTAWRVTILDGEKVLASKQSFMW